MTTPGQIFDQSVNALGGHAGSKPSGFSPTQQDAFTLMAHILQTWGLTSLQGDLHSLILKGDTNADTLTLALSQTQAYKTRFAGNELRRQNGLAELSPAEYLSLERGYHQVLQQYGLPRGFYDNPTDFTDFIGKDLSVHELELRAQVAHDQYEAAPAAMKQLWSQYFGTKGDAIASILDPKVATQVIQDRGVQVGIGGAAAANGLAINQRRAQQFQQAGIDINQAQKAYQQIAQLMPTDKNIANRFGTTFGQTQEENDLLLGQAGAADQRATLYNEEKSLFNAKPAFDQQALGVSQTY